MAELPDDIHSRILAHSTRGDDLAAEDDFAEAIREYWQAWDLLPEPATQWDAAT